MKKRLNKPCVKTLNKHTTKQAKVIKELATVFKKLARAAGIIQSPGLQKQHPLQSKKQAVRKPFG